jgi:hypothetical protein
VFPMYLCIQMRILEYELHKESDYIGCTREYGSFAREA